MTPPQDAFAVYPIALKDLATIRVLIDCPD